MPSTFTPYLNLEKPGLGEQANTWGTTINSNLDKVDTGVKANNTATAPIPGMQTQITALQSSDTMQTSNITNLQGRVSTLESQVATLQGQVATLQSQVGTLQAQMGTANTNITANTNSINTLNNTTIPGINSQINSLQSQINAIPKNSTQITIAEQDLNSGTMTGHWVTVHLDNGAGKAWTLGFGAGTAQQGDSIQLPSGMVNYAWQPFCQSIAAESIPNPIEYFHVSRSGAGSLQVNQASGSTSSNAFDRGVVLAGWSAMAYKNS